MNFTAQQLQRMYDSGNKLEAIKNLRAQCDAGLKQANDAFLDRTVEAVMSVCEITKKRRKLEAAAPDLLAALKAMIEDYRSEGCPDPKCGVCARSKKALEDANAAIAKAEG